MGAVRPEESPLTVPFHVREFRARLQQHQKQQHQQQEKKDKQKKAKTKFSHNKDRCFVSKLDRLMAERKPQKKESHTQKTNSGWNGDN